MCLTYPYTPRLSYLNSITIVMGGPKERKSTNAMPQK